MNCKIVKKGDGNLSPAVKDWIRRHKKRQQAKQIKKSKRLGENPFAKAFENKGEGK
jgi:hypothetical protein